MQTRHILPGKMKRYIRKDRLDESSGKEYNENITYITGFRSGVFGIQGG